MHRYRYTMQLVTENGHEELPFFAMCMRITAGTTDSKRELFDVVSLISGTRPDLGFHGFMKWLQAGRFEIQRMHYMPGEDDESNSDLKTAVMQMASEYQQAMAKK